MVRGTCSIITSIVLFLIIFYCAPVYGGDVQFISNVDKNKVGINGRITLTLTLKGTQDTGEPVLPPSDDFSIISSGTSSRFSFTNGRMSSTKQFTYILIPNKEGILTIPSAEISAGGKVLKTRPIKIEVVKGAAVPGNVPYSGRPAAGGNKNTSASPSQGTSDRIFVEVTTDKKTAYPGEQIIMTFRLYRRGVMINNLQYTPPETKSFITESMGRQKEYRDIINGEEYDVIELKTAVFPVAEGELTIGPAKLRCDLLERAAGPGRGRRSVFSDFFGDSFFDDPFFSSYTRRPIELQSKPLAITVKPLPKEGAPPSFKGTVGRFNLSVEASPRELKAGEPVNLVVKVSGTGNISGAAEPVIKDLAGFKTYDPEVKTNITAREPDITGEKVFRRVIIPKSSGIKEIPQIEFSYFDPEDGQYHTVTNGPIPITVHPAPKGNAEIVELMKGAASRESESKKAVKLLAKDIQFIKASPGRFYTRRGFWYTNVWIWAAIVFIPLIKLGVAYIYRRHKVRLTEDEAYAKARGARGTAKRFLREAARYKKQGMPKEFYGAAAKAVEKFISEKLNVPPGAVSAVSAETLLRGRGVKDTVIASVRQLLEECDLARYGAQDVSGRQMKEMIKKAEAAIEMLNRRL